MSTRPVVHWFRSDLRLADNPALAAAVDSGAPLVLVYVLDETAAGRWAPGAAARWWLHHSLAALTHDIEMRGGRLLLLRGAARGVIADLVRETGAGMVTCSRAHEPWSGELERQLKLDLEGMGVALKRYAGRLLHEPESIRAQAGDPYRVYTPFWRAVLGAGAPRRPSAAPQALKPLRAQPDGVSLADLKLQPTAPDWAGGLRASWRPGEDGARERLGRFLEADVARYHELRDRPDTAGTSRLSPHLAFGEISPSTVWHAARAREFVDPAAARGVEVFLKELVWREFSAHLLHHFPTLPERPLRADLDGFPWREDATQLAAWQRGRTGYPIVDAGMRELWATGYMHNRVRMIVASFLIKDLMIPWQHGEAWFWDTLVDADLASNAASWQWVAGTGADAAPYFRVFNPVTQGIKFDPDGAYVRRWVPELAELPAPAIHAPWEAAAAVLAAAGVRLGQSYPLPLVDHALARRRALEAYGACKQERAAGGSAFR